MSVCQNCNKITQIEDTYRCRICGQTYCDYCSLDHFGLVEHKNKVRYKSIFKQITWLLKKQLGVFDNYN